MKRIITILLLALSFGASAQFNSALHSPSNKPFAPNGKPTDARSYYYDASTFTYRPYASRSEILTYLNATSSRSGSFPIFMDSAGKRYELWFTNGTADINLEYKSYGSAGGGSDFTASAPLNKSGSSLTLNYNTEGLKINGNNSLEAKAKIFGSLNHLRGLLVADSVSTYGVYYNKDFHFFRYDPSDVTSADDSAMVIVANGLRFKRVIQQTVYPEDFGAIGDGVTDDGPSFNKMYRWMEKSMNNVKNVAHKHTNYRINTTIKLPGNLAVHGKKARIFIDGSGVIYNTTAPITVIERMPSSQDEALNQWYDDWSFHLKGLIIQGTQTAGQVGLKLGAFYTPVLEDVKGLLLDTGAVATFWLNGTIKDCEFNNNLSVGFKGASGEGYWPGAITTNSAFNANTFYKTRFFNKLGSYTSLMLLAADQTMVRECVSEGSKPLYNFYYDFQGSTAVNNNTFEDPWIETVGPTPNVNFYLRWGGTITIKGVQREYPDTILSLSPTSGSTARLIVENIPYMGNLPDRPFNGGGSSFSGRYFKFDNLGPEAPFAATDTTLWVGGVAPSTILVNNFLNSGGGPEIRTNSALRLSPYYNSPAAQRRLDLRGGIWMTDDNVYTLGGSANNQRPFRGLFGTGGVWIDPNSNDGLSFGSATAAVDFKFHWVRTGVARMTGKALILPAGTTAERPTGADNGAFRFNTDSARLEQYSNVCACWQQYYPGLSGSGGPADAMTRSAIETVTGKKTFQPDVTASSGRAYGLELNPTLRAAANNDILSGFRMVVSPVVGSYTGVQGRALDIQFPVSGGDLSSYLFNNSGTAGSKASYIATSNTTSITMNSDGVISTSGTGITNQIPSGQIFKVLIGGVDKGRWSSTGLRIGDNLNPTYSFEIAGTDGFKLPVGTAAQRPTGTNGLARYILDSNRVEIYANGSWKGLAFTNELGSGGVGAVAPTLVTPNDANYTITSGTGNLSIVYFNTLTAERTVTLPDPAANTGRIFTLKHGGGGLFNINLSANIYENSTTWITSLAPGASITFMSDGTQFIKTR